VRSRRFSYRFGDLLEPSSVGDQVVYNMAVLNDIGLDDFALKAVNQFGKVEVYFSIAVFKRRYIHAVFEVL
jgi:hypothetical protein